MHILYTYICIFNTNDNNNNIYMYNIINTIKTYIYIYIYIFFIDRPSGECVRLFVLAPGRTTLILQGGRRYLNFISKCSMI